MNWFVVKFILTTSFTTLAFVLDLLKSVSYQSSPFEEAVGTPDYTVTLKLWHSSRPKYIENLIVVYFKCIIMPLKMAATYVHVML